MLVKEPAEYPEPDEEEASNEALLNEPKSNEFSLPSAPPPQKVVLFCPLPGEVRRLKWRLTKFFADHLDIIYMYAEMGNDERTEMQLKLQDSPNPCVRNYTQSGWDRPQSHVSKPCGNNSEDLGVQWAVASLARVVRLGQNRVPHTWLLNTGPNGYDNRATDLHQLSGVGQMGVLHGLMNQPNITTTMIYRILECRQDHTKRITEQRDFMPSDGEDERLWSGQWHQGTPL